MAAFESTGSRYAEAALDRKIYTGALTLEFEAPPDVAVLSNGRLLAEQIGAPADRWDREYVRREGGRLYVTAYSNTRLEFFTPSAPPDASGTYKLTYGTRNGLQRESSLVLKQNGAELTGTLSGDRGSTPITEGRIEGGRLSLAIVRKGNGDEVPVAITGAWASDVLHLTLQFRSGEPLAATARR